VGDGDGNGDAAAGFCADGAALFTGGNGEAAAGALAAVPDELTGGNGDAAPLDWFGKGAGNAPCARACPANTAIADKVSGISKRRTVTVSPQIAKGRSRLGDGPNFTIPQGG
jgi:hypothetical protein